MWVNLPSKVHAFFQTEDEYISWREKDFLNGSLDSYTLESWENWVVPAGSTLQLPSMCREWPARTAPNWWWPAVKRTSLSKAGTEWRHIILCFGGQPHNDMTASAWFMCIYIYYLYVYILLCSCINFWAFDTANSTEILVAHVPEGCPQQTW